MSQTWIDRNLQTQCFTIDSTERRRLRVGLRFATGVCMGLVAVGLVLGAPLVFAALLPIALLAGWGSRNPLDRLYNAVAVRRGAALLPPTPRRRRHSFKVGAVWLAAIGVLFAVGLGGLALALGTVLLGVCGLQTATYFCLPSITIAAFERLRAPAA